MTTTSTGQAPIRITPIARAPWPDVEAVFGTRGDPARCWCQYFKVTPEGWREGDAATFREALREQTAASPAGPGLVAHLDDEPVGWCGVEPRCQYPALQRSRLLRGALLDDFEDPSVWSVTCFVVRVGHRRQGIAAALLDGAVEHARASGARVLEAYPVDAERKAGVSAAELYHGPLGLFLAAGFTETARPSETRAVVRIDLG
jgi:GNAT superfamily N-acetyltransferase